MTPEVRKFVERHAKSISGKVLEVGSYEVHSPVTRSDFRDLFPDAVRSDMRAGPNVNLVCKAEDLLDHFQPETFDAVVSTETMEHMENWPACIKAMWAVLKTGGWLLMTMSSPAKRLHGYPSDYWRATPDLIEQIFGVKGEYVGGLSVGWVLRKADRAPDLTVKLIRIT